MTEPDRGAPLADDGSRDRIESLLRSVAASDGFVPFDRFMEVALYGEGVGYYARPGTPFGPDGDYYTAAHASPLFGAAVAERVASALEAIPAPQPVRVVEVGPGDGTLATSVLRGLAGHPGIRGRLEYHLVERSAPLAVRALEDLSSVGETVDIPVRAAGGIGADGPFDGVVLANELLDAQPVRRLQWEDGEWHELGVRLEGHRLCRATGPFDRPVPPPNLPVGVEPGAILEVSPMAEALVREAADHLVRGLALFLDYGMEESELLAAHPSGTLAAVRRHRDRPDPLSEPGLSDLSTFVNFTRVRAAAAAAGLRELTFQKQSIALGEWGFPRLLEKALESAPSSEAKVRVQLAAKNLLFGFERFHALELAPPERTAR